MPFALWIGKAFASVLAFFGEYMTKKLALVAAAIASFSAVLLTFKLAIDAAIAGLLTITPDGILLTGLQLLPSNTGNCITAMATGYTAAQAYVYWRNIIAFKLTPA
ncbi:hypothetical protein [uncultured Methylophaga sp.]|uniref:hypothetical protein n=1 Tax=uncultured Methylophaga sp. TaxID=285271 RepID=UPI0026147F18|nr:hypothetical protein [uncultured Methylophaga sp.]